MRIIVVLAIVVAAVVARPEGDFYDEKYDSFNTKEIIDNIKILENMAGCMLNEGKCTAEAKELKKLVPEAVKTQCGKCTDNQKPKVAEVIKAIMEKLPEKWEKLSALYDEKGEYAEDFNKFLDKYSPK